MLIGAKHSNERAALLRIDDGWWDTGEQIAGGVIATDAEMAGYNGSNWYDIIRTPWAVCRLTSRNSGLGFLAHAGCGDFETLDVFAAFRTEAEARAALRARGYLDEDDARARYRGGLHIALRSFSTGGS